MKFDLSICTISTNEWQVLKDCISSIKSEANENLYIQLIIVNNCSNDYDYDSLISLTSANLKIEVINNRNKNNFSANNNIAIRKALSDIILILNPDTIIKKGTLRYMVDFMNKNKEVGAATCKLTYADGTFQECGRKFLKINYQLASRFKAWGWNYSKKSYNEYIMSKELDRYSKEVDWILGACMFVRKKVFDEIGLFDERFILYFEDADLCYRIKEAGWRVMYVPDVSIIHFYARTAAKNIFNKAALLQLYTTFLFYAKHYWRVIK